MCTNNLIEMAKRFAEIQYVAKYIFKGKEVKVDYDDGTIVIDVEIGETWDGRNKRDWLDLDNVLKLKDVMDELGYHYLRGVIIPAKILIMNSQSAKIRMWFVEKELLDKFGYANKDMSEMDYEEWLKMFDEDE